MRSILTRLTVFAPVAGAVAAPATLVFAPQGNPALAAVRGSQAAAEQGAATTGDANSLEDAAQRAGRLGRTVALSLIGLALAAAAVMLVFRRDFKEAAGAFTVGLLAALPATPSGLRLLQSTADLLFGSR
jgi:hypothetical protein